MLIRLVNKLIKQHGIPLRMHQHHILLEITTIPMLHILVALIQSRSSPKMVIIYNHQAVTFTTKEKVGLHSILI